MMSKAYSLLCVTLLMAAGGAPTVAAAKHGFCPSNSPMVTLPFKSLRFKFNVKIGANILQEFPISALRRF